MVVCDPSLMGEEPSPLTSPFRPAVAAVWAASPLPHHPRGFWGRWPVILMLGRLYRIRHGGLNRIYV